MCMIEKEDKTVALKKELELGPITMYKVVGKNLRNKICSPYYTEHIWNVGINQDESDPKMGFYCFLYKEDAFNLLNSKLLKLYIDPIIPSHVIEVKGYKEDFIAAGVDDSDLSHGVPVAVFNEVYVNSLDPIPDLEECLVDQV